MKEVFSAVLKTDYKTDTDPTIIEIKFIMRIFGDLNVNAIFVAFYICTIAKPGNFKYLR